MGTGAIEPFPGLELTPEMLEAVTVEECLAQGDGSQPDVRLLLYRPRRLSGPMPLVVSIHGGAFALRADHFAAVDARLAMLGCLVASVDYRSLPEHRFPSAPEDCYHALCWAVGHLEVDPTRVVVTGVSAGGALAAAVTLMARDRGGPAIRLQALTIPVIDDRCETTSIRQFPEGPYFGGVQAVEMWTAYLGTESRASTSPYAAPGRAANLSGLPDAFVLVGGLDPLRDEGMAYAARLMEEGVAVELYCAPGMHHGLPDDSRTAAHATALHLDAISAAIAAP